MPCGTYRHPLQRGGASQPQRLSDALKSDFARVDEKDLADWIVYAEALSAFIKFYNDKNGEQGDWTPFFSRDVSAVLAQVATLDPDTLSGFGVRLEFLREYEGSDKTPAQKALAELFGGATTFAKGLDALTARLPADSPLRRVISNLIEVKFAPGMKRLLAYHLVASPADPSKALVQGGTVPGWRIFGVPVSDLDTVLTEGLSPAWPKKSNVTGDDRIYGSAVSVLERIRQAANHNLFTSIFDQFQMGYARILKEATANLQLTLADWRKHPPHYALFLSFLKLLKEVQGELNRFTARHLDFYYNDVLRLKPRPPAADNAYVVIGLAKSVATHLLPKDTLFRAGKDSRGDDLYYSLTKDVVLNKASIGKLMAVYQGSEQDNLEDSGIVNEDRLFAAPVINSADGLGAKLTTAQGDWHPFVNRTYVDGAVESIDEPLATIGLAIASHYLALAEGQRNIKLRLVTNNNAAVGDFWDIYLTTEKGWLAISNPDFEIGSLDGDECVVIRWTVEAAAPAITNYDAKVHGGTLGVSLPIAKLLLRNDPGAEYKYESVRDVTVTKIAVEVEVGPVVEGSFPIEGVKQLVLANSAGPVDPAKPFLPFGPQPEAGDSLIVGSKEIFSKKGARVQFAAEWIKLPAKAKHIGYKNNSNPWTALDFLEGGVWDDPDVSLTLFDGVRSGVTFPSAPVGLPDESIISYDEPFESYSNGSRGGFLRIRLAQGFGHKKYLSALTTHLIKLAKSETTKEPKEPYTPTLQSLTISYTATAVEDLTSEAPSGFSNRSIRLFHLYPFGDVEQHTQSSGDLSVYLLPQFRYAEPAGGSSEEAIELENRGEFYIGLENLAPGESISILFQLLEGSSDPQVLKPDKHVYFSYLSNNAWKAISRNIVSDSTNQLIQSGLIELPIPSDATTDNTLMPSGYIWLRLSVAEKADAICRIIAALPQAALVTSPAPWLESALPAGTIAKLKEPVTAIKSITQPYTSFRIGGGGETKPLFYARASERLRHKDRAINIWDYERLVLQAFPQIHKVKCLSHTRLVEDPKNSGKIVCNELAPGHVLVVTIPELAGRNDANPLRPYTNAGVIVEMQEYLRRRTSCHASVTVANPLFEELRMDFKVTLTKGYSDAVYYCELLQEEITTFLTPWANDSSVDIQFGGKVYKSTLINFIEERAYVDYLTDVKLFHKAGDDAPESGDLEEVVGTSARSILVSAPASKHNIVVTLHEDASQLTEECAADE
jgi:hypothetical protein